MATTKRTRTANKSNSQGNPFAIAHAAEARLRSLQESAGDNAIPALEAVCEVGGVYAAIHEAANDSESAALHWASVAADLPLRCEPQRAADHPKQHGKAEPTARYGHRVRAAAFPYVRVFTNREMVREALDGMGRHERAGYLTVSALASLCPSRSEGRAASADKTFAKIAASAVTDKAGHVFQTLLVVAKGWSNEAKSDATVTMLNDLIAKHNITVA